MTYKYGKGRKGKNEELSSQAREIEILKIIYDFPRIHHNGLIREASKKMAKKTAEKTIGHLLDRQLIFVQKEKNRKRFTIRPSSDSLDVDVLENGIRVWIAILSGNVANLETFYKQAVLIHKVNLTIFLINSASIIVNGLTFLNALKNPSENIYEIELKKVRENIKKIFDVVENDKDHDLIYPSVRDRITNANQMRPQSLDDNTKYAKKLLKKS